MKTTLIEKESVKKKVPCVSKRAADRLDFVKVYICKTAKDLCEELFGVKEEHIASISTKSGKAVTFQQFVDHKSRQGFHGFAVPELNEVYCWFGEGCSESQKLALMAHELEHIVRKNRPVTEEGRANLTAAIAVRAAQILKSFSVFKETDENT